MLSKPFVGHWPKLGSQMFELGEHCVEGWHASEAQPVFAPLTVAQHTSPPAQSSLPWHSISVTRQALPVQLAQGVFDGSMQVHEVW